MIAHLIIFVVDHPKLFTGIDSSQIRHSFESNPFPSPPPIAVSSISLSSSSSFHLVSSNAKSFGHKGPASRALPIFHVAEVVLETLCCF
uniref:Uncharacterized protein n=1 Tax=Caenorhabditis japonica TaxID=281687 RepID=A0A8R1EJJ3_CAEJA